MDVVIWNAAGVAALLWAGLLPFPLLARVGAAALGATAILTGWHVARSYRARWLRIRQAGHSPRAWGGRRSKVNR